MRVLETDPTILYKMGKNKKHRIRKSKENAADDSSDDGLQGCSHISKAVNLAAMRKAIMKTGVTLGECSGCAKEATKSTSRDLFGSIVDRPAAAAAAGDGDDMELIEPTICVCLQCGHQGCDRSSPNKHALKHYKTPHSGIHCIIVNLTHWTVWCYACDEDVTSNTRIQSCVDFLQKQSGLGKPESLHAGKSPDSQNGDTDGPMPNTAASKMPTSCVKVKGLSNLGNTCFFNAVMQNMCQTRGLESLLVDWSRHGKTCNLSVPEINVDTDSSSSDEEKEEESAEPKSLPTIQTNYGDAGPISVAMLNFLQEMKGGTTKNGTVNPNILFTQVCKKAPRFKGFQQQDSHELLRYLVDCIRTEEIKRGQSSILKYFKLPETVNPKKVDEETKFKIKEYGRQVKHTFLDSLFGGQLVSTVKCEECTHVSQIFEAFLDLSLPVTEEKPQRPNLVLIGKKKDAVTLADQGDGPSQAAAAMGLDSFDKPSKYQERKNKRLAKKDTKKNKKLQKLKSQGSHEGVSEKGDGEDKPTTPDLEHGSDDSNKNDNNFEAVTQNPGEADVLQIEQGLKRLSLTTGDASSTSNSANESGRVEGLSDNKAQKFTSSPEGSKDGLDTNDGDPDDPSDADVEDNLESDMSRLEIGDRSFSQQPDNSSKYIDSTYPTRTTNGDSQIPNTESLVNGYEDIVNNNVDITNLPDDKCSLQADNNQIVETKSADVSVTNNAVNGAGLGGSFSFEVKVNNFSEPNGCEQSVNSVPMKDNNKEDRVHEGTNSPQVSATFNLTLPSSAVTDQSTGKVCISTTVDKPKEMQYKTQQEYMKEARNHSMNTLAPRYHPAPKECSILTCLNQFTAAELLTGSNKVSCKECTKLKTKSATHQKVEKKSKEKVCSNASKQYLIFRPPAVLTLHLKRFEQTGLTSRKVNRHVDFPLVLDLAPYCSSLCPSIKRGQTKVLYSLYGVVEHSGRLSGGHYTAYVKVRPGLGPITQFLHNQAPTHQDILNSYMERVVKMNKESQDSGVADIDIAHEHDAEALVPPGRWFHISDSRVNEVTESEVLKAQAYLVFYERIV